MIDDKSQITKTIITMSQTHICPCRSVPVETEIISFCQKEMFKSYVRDAINNEMFWRDIFDRYRVESRVDNHLSSKVPQLVRDNVTYTLPGLVVEQLGKQLPTYLNQNIEMQRILTDHAQRLNQTLETSARTHLQKIVNEDQYHEVHKAFFDAINSRTNTVINEIKQNGQTAINMMQQQCDQRLSHFSEQVGKLDGFERSTKELEQKVSNLEYRTSSLLWCWGLTVGVLGGIIFHLMK